MTAVMLNERSGVVRTFTSLNLAEAIYGNGVPITGPSDILTRFPTHEKLVQVYENCWHWCNERSPLHDANFLTPALAWESERTYIAQCLWKLCVDRGDQTTRIPKVQNANGEGKMEDHSYVIDLRMAKAVLASKNMKIVRQARQLIQVFHDEGYDFFTKNELRRMLSSPKACQTIKSRQDNWRIFRYYAPTLISLGVLVVNNKE